MLGCEHTSESSILYFEKSNINRINIILNKLEYIDKWKWAEIKEENWNQKCKDFFKSCSKLTCIKNDFNKNIFFAR